MMEELLDLVRLLEVVKASQKALQERESKYKERLLEIMQELGIEKEDTDYGCVRIQRRAEKDYGEQIRTMEIELKEAKKLAEDLGDYTVIGVKESIVFVPPKELF
jgi:phage anti-repressor protein